MAIRLEVSLDTFIIYLVDITSPSCTISIVNYSECCSLPVIVDKNLPSGVDDISEYSELSSSDITSEIDHLSTPERAQKHPTRVKSQFQV